MIVDIAELSGGPSYRVVSKWVEDRGNSDDDIFRVLQTSCSIGILCSEWMTRRAKLTAGEDTLRSSDPISGRCDLLGRLKVILPDLSPANIAESSLVVRSAHKEDNDIVSPNEGGSKPGGDLPKKEKPRDILSATLSPFRIVKSSMECTGDTVDEVASQLEYLHTTDNDEQAALELPIFVGEYKRSTDLKDRQTVTNQIRMYLTASAKYLEAVGVTGVPVYGVQVEGPIATISAAVSKADGVRIPTVHAYADERSAQLIEFILQYIHLFEHLTNKIDISTPIGAWHLATIFSRLAVTHAARLERAFDKAEFVQKARCGGISAWTAAEQIAALSKKIQVQEPAVKQRTQ